MGWSETREYDALLTTTLANFSKQLSDNIFDVYPLLSYLNGKLGGIIRGGKSIKRMLDGGERIAEHILFEASSNINSFSGAEIIDVTLQDGMTLAFYDFKQYSGAIGITGREKRANRGEAKLLNLLDGKTKQCTMSLRDRMSVDAYSDGTGNSSKNLTGLQALVSTTATVGGIAPGTYTWWQASVETGAGSFAANGINLMRSKYLDVTYGNDRPDAIFTDQTTYERYEGQLQPLERFSDTKSADGGFENLKFKATPVFFDRDCTSGYMYFLNSNYLKFNVSMDCDMVTTPFVTPENQDVSTAKVLWEGNMTTNDRRKLGVIQGFTA
jgi:hypothetical protein